MLVFGQKEKHPACEKSDSNSAPKFNR